ncbi:MAG: hypothetical protein KGL59_03675 [Acidobacteriota bacterium]|nr:hypothetical protein [Acidobacteriota bacterium]
MNRLVQKGVMVMAALVLAALPAAAGTVTGVVHNGTTGQVGAGVQVILIQLQNGMQDVAQTKTDAQGRFQLSYAQIGQQPMLLRAVYEGVFYHAPIPPGQSNANVDINIFQPTTDASAFQVLHHIIAVEPQTSNLMVGEEYDIQNKTKPPKAYYKADGCFTFELPKGAELSQVEAWGPDGMPVVQGTVDKGNNKYAIVFPFRPGDNGVRFSYKLDYPSQQATLHLASVYPVTTAMLLAPPQVKVIAEGFSPAGSEHGWSVYSRGGMKADEPMVFSVSGTGPPPGSDNGQAGGAAGDQGGSADSGNAVTPVAQALPPRLDSLKWILVGGFGALFILGAAFLWWKSRQPQVAGVAAVAGGAGVAMATPAPPRMESTVGGEQTLRQSVDEIKETLFRLELRRQAGTLSEEAYQAQRKQMEKALRELVKG